MLLDSRATGRQNVSLNRKWSVAMDYISTRGRAQSRSFEQTVMAGLAEDGGLFVPARWPALTNAAKRNIPQVGFAAAGAEMLAPLIGDLACEQAVGMALTEAARSFDHPDTTPLIEIGPNRWLM
ncbi:MAG: hypothetical protein U9N14_02895, partial [Pseudomonadota bacterium]|nr:hypothetical protein [Pseudomonadota bacterium]